MEHNRNKWRKKLHQTQSQIELTNWIRMNEWNLDFRIPNTSTGQFVCLHLYSIVPIDDYVDEIFFLSKLSTKTYMDFFCRVFAIVINISIVCVSFKCFNVWVTPLKYRATCVLCWAVLCYVDGPIFQVEQLLKWNEQ